MLVFSVKLMIKSSVIVSFSLISTCMDMHTFYLHIIIIRIHTRQLLPMHECLNKFLLLCFKKCRSSI